MTPRPQLGFDEVEALLEQAERFGEIKRPENADEPILAAPVRAAVYEWLLEINERATLAAAGIAPRRTALLFGPPGTGKTTLAHHIAARLGVPLIAVRSETLVDKYVGSTARNIGAAFSIFDQLGEAALILFDEIDAIGSARDGGGEAARERNQFLTTLLARVEAFQGTLIAATNMREMLDAALWRRFGMQIDVALPGHDEIFAIIRRYAAPFDPTDAVIDDLAIELKGASPALIRQLIEQIKRTMLLAPKLRGGLPSFDQALRQAVLQMGPPPNCPVPPLWNDENALQRLGSRSMQWPWIRMKESA
jgi:SpoVK/Ycf46/Vps4 family AAA+-type ATPase